MEMCEADGCKTIGNDGDCGELGECLPRPKAFKLKTKHTEDQTKNLLVGLMRLLGCHLRPLEEGEDLRTRTKPRERPAGEGWTGRDPEDRRPGKSVLEA